VLLRSEGVWDGDDLATYLGQAALVLAVGAAFRLAGLRGSLEMLTGALSNGARRTVEGGGASRDGRSVDSVAP
jgi:hypothetical protein